MAHTTSYSQLVADIKRWCDHEETDFNTEVDQIIERAQDRLQMDLDFAIWRSFNDITLSSGASEYDYSANDWLTITGLFLSNGEPIVPRSMDYCRMFSGSGTPKYYCIKTEGTIYVSPQPSSNTSASVEVMVRQPVLNGSNTTNWFTKYAAGALLYGCLAEAERFLTSPERAAEFEGEYQKHLAAVRNEQRGHMSRTEYNDPKASPPQPAEMA